MTEKETAELKQKNEQSINLSNSELPNQEMFSNLSTPPDNIKNDLNNFIIVSPPTINSKICTKCKTGQPLSNFGKQSLLKDRLKTWCKSCVSNYHKLRYKNIKIKKKIKKQVKTWQTNNPEKIKKYQAAYVQKIWEQVRTERAAAFQNQSQISLPTEQV